MTTFTDKEEVTVESADEIGDDFRRLVRVEGHDEAQGEHFEFTSLKDGFLAEAQTEDGQTVGAPRITDSTTIGSTEPEYLRNLAEALEEFASVLEDVDSVEEPEVSEVDEDSVIRASDLTESAD